MCYRVLYDIKYFIITQSTLFNKGVDIGCEVWDTCHVADMLPTKGLSQMFYDLICLNRNGQVVYTECIEATDRMEALLKAAEIVKWNPLLKIATWTIKESV